MTTPLLLLRAVQLGVHISEMDLLTIGTLLDMYSELNADDMPPVYTAGQDDNLTGFEKMYFFCQHICVYYY